MNRVEFDSTKKPLDELLKQAHEGSLPLPDFQRGWVWEDERLRGLLASVSRFVRKNSESDAEKGVARV